MCIFIYISVYQQQAQRLAVAGKKNKREKGRGASRRILMTFLRMSVRRKSITEKKEGGRVGNKMLHERIISYFERSFAL